MLEAENRQSYGSKCVDFFTPERMLIIMKKNYYLDVLLFVSGLICIVTGIMLDFHLISGGREARFLYKNIHIYSGYIMGIGLLVHLLWHKGWITMATKKIFVQKNTPVQTPERV